MSNIGKTQPIHPLRQRMIEDMTLRGISQTSQSGYIRCVRNCCAHLKLAPGAPSRYGKCTQKCYPWPQSKRAFASDLHRVPATRASGLELSRTPATRPGAAGCAGRAS
ncbi:MAG: hypothetical protein ACO33A_10915 [Hyphomonas sp.]